jgi:hypothetical protein
MLQVSYLDVAYVLQYFFKCFSGAFACVSEACFKCFICFQTYVANMHLDVSKINRVLHMGTHVGSGRGQVRSPHVVWQRGQRPGSAVDVRRHTGGDVLTRASAARGRWSAARASVRTSLPIKNHLPLPAINN